MDSRSTGLGKDGFMYVYLDARNNRPLKKFVICHSEETESTKNLLYWNALRFFTSLRSVQNDSKRDFFNNLTRIDPGQ
jgi:hypothetical protein